MSSIDLPEETVTAASPKPTLVLHRFSTKVNQFDGSPWCNRLDALLTFSFAPFTYSPTPASNQKSPSGRVPYLFIGDELFTDSLFAYQGAVDRGLAKDLDGDLTEKENALTRMLAATVRELNYCLEKERWMDEYYHARDVMLGPIPWPIRLVVGSMVYRRLHAKLAAIEITTITPSQLTQYRDSAFDALVSVLKNDDGTIRHYALGKKDPTMADSCIVGILAAPLHTSKWNPAFIKAIKERPVLMDYLEGVRKTWWPERESFLDVE